MAKKQPREVLYITLFLLLVLLFFVSLSLLPGPASVPLGNDAQGGYDLVGSNLEDVVYVTAAVWDTWPEKIYTPGELAKAEQSVPCADVDYSSVQYATHRLLLRLPAGKTYGVSLRSANYAMRLYIDGTEVDSMGNPGAAAEDTVPQVRDAVYYIAPQGETVEFVVQASNFVNHQAGGKAPALTIGTAEAISRHELNANLKAGVIFGCLMTAFLYHLAIFLMNRRQRASLVFAVLCLLLALVSKDFAALLFPAYSWYVAVRVEYFIYILAANMLLVLVNILFPGAIQTRRRKNRPAPHSRAGGMPSPRLRPGLPYWWHWLLWRYCCGLSSGGCP